MHARAKEIKGRKYPKLTSCERYWLEVPVETSGADAGRMTWHEIELIAKKRMKLETGNLNMIDTFFFLSLEKCINDGLISCLLEEMERDEMIIPSVEIFSFNGSPKDSLDFLFIRIQDIYQRYIKKEGRKRKMERRRRTSRFLPQHSSLWQTNFPSISFFQSL